MTNNLAHSDIYSDPSSCPRVSKMDENKAVKAAALRFLARREYSHLELFRKLSQKFSSVETIQGILE